jgi:hypothetical protein
MSILRCQDPPRITEEVQVIFSPPALKSTHRSQPDRLRILPIVAGALLVFVLATGCGAGSGSEKVGASALDAPGTSPSVTTTTWSNAEIVKRNAEIAADKFRGLSDSEKQHIIAEQKNGDTANSSLAGKAHLVTTTTDFVEQQPSPDSGPPAAVNAVKISVLALLTEDMLVKAVPADVASTDATRRGAKRQ